TAEAARAHLGLAAVLAAQQRGAEALAALDDAEQEFRREGNAVGVARVQLQRAEWARRSSAECGVRRAEDRPPDGGPDAPFPTPHFALRTPHWEQACCEATAALRMFRHEGLKLAAAEAHLLLAELHVKIGGHPLPLLRRLVKEAQAEELVPLLW